MGFHVRWKLALSLALVISLTPYTHSINFDLTPGDKKCLREEVHKDDIVAGEFKIYRDQVNIPVTVRVTDIREQTLYTKDDASEGKFGFTLDYSGQYSVCFHSMSAPSNLQSNSIQVGNLFKYAMLN